jgi:NADH dehydrogenase
MRKLKNRKRVVIVGMGFGGLCAARELAGSELEVLCLDRQNYHLFQPLLYQVATATLDQESITYPLRALMHDWPNVEFIRTQVGGVDLEKREVQTAEGPLPYDYLLLAPGSATNFFGMESVQQHAYDLKQLSDAVGLRNQILSAFEQAAKETDEAKRRALMTFVIVGGGPTGVEFAGALAELTHGAVTKDYPHLPIRNTRIVLVEAEDHLLSPYPAPLQEYARRRLQELGVEVKLGAKVSGMEQDCVVFKDGSRIPSHTLFWAAGVQASPLSAAINVPKARGGRIPVEPDLTLKEYPSVYVVGDLAHLEVNGQPLPMLAQVAMQGGEYAAHSILARQANRTLEPFEYFDKGSMAVIGRGAAVAVVRGVQSKGFLAWLLWLGLHIFFLIGTRNRFNTLLSWAYDYVFYNRQVRVITDEA